MSLILNQATSIYAYCIILCFYFLYVLYSYGFQKKFFSSVFCSSTICWYVLTREGARLKDARPKDAALTREMDQSIGRG